MLEILLLGIICCIYTIESSHKHRHLELARITKYELIHITPKSVDIDTKILEFDVFNQHYKVELTINHDMNPSLLKHTNIDPTTHKHQHFTSSTKSCHYHGRVLNAPVSSNNYVAMSLCTNSGIRGRIVAFNETLIIKPSAYYLDLPTDSKCSYTLNDELLVYRVSDFDTSGIDAREESITIPDKLQSKIIDTPRRLAYSSSNRAKTEIYVIAGPVRIENYKSDYPDRWYQQLVEDTTSMINQVSAIYMKTNWGGGSVGGANSISIVFAEIEIITRYIGDYAALKPNKLYTNCQLGDDDFDDSDDCAINGNEWLGIIKNWISRHKDTSTFDNAQFITDMRFKWSKSGGGTSRTLGWGYIGTVCAGASSVSDVSVIAEWGGNDKAVGTIAHELGHNFGLEHDGQGGAAADCGPNDGLMGYGNNDDTFSRCSIRSMQEYFSKRNGLTCIGTGYDGTLKTNHEAGTANTPQPTTKAPTTRSPTTKAPTTRAPTTRSPTDAGQTPAPTTTTTQAPTTRAPTTKSPTTKSPTTKAPTTKSPTRADGTSGGCIRIGGIDDYFYDGEWGEIDGGYGGKSAYSFVNGNGRTTYLYYRAGLSLGGTSARTKWIIGSSLGGTSIYVFCPNEDLLTCGGAWMKYSGGSWPVVSTSTTDANCGAAEPFDPTCGGYDCLTISGVPGYDGRYSSTPSCYNKQRLYKLGDSDKYLCYNQNYGRWIVTIEASKSTCSPYRGKMQALSGSTSSSILTNTGWYVAKDTSGSYSWSSSVMINDCGGNSAFNIEDLQCLTNNKYANNLCMYSNNTLWSGERTFKLYTKLCSNEQPVYHYTLYNTSKIVGNGEFDNNVEATYYLHFHRQKIYSDSNETVGQWLISKNDISVNAIAVCEKDNLLECTANVWEIETTTLQSENFTLGGLLLRIKDKHLTIKDGICDSDVNVNVEHDDEGGDTAIIVVVVVVILIVIIAIAGYCICKKMNQNESEKIKQSIGTNSNRNTVDDEPDIEVEVSMERDAITQTND